MIAMPSGNLLYLIPPLLPHLVRISQKIQIPSDNPTVSMVVKGPDNPTVSMVVKETVGLATSGGVSAAAFAAVGCSLSELAIASRSFTAAYAAAGWSKSTSLQLAAPVLRSGRGSSNPHNSGIRAWKRLQLSGALVYRQADLSGNSRFQHSKFSEFVDLAQAVAQPLPVYFSVSVILCY
ncbi:hypothetical protein M9H77_16000 [Catharanthus roseus]|uniref:Uncharacterized protein n=1 Tax=Catharanthus roseus TaxID=4058 RepID=A0ACC0AYP1_CATRO|nr:hypothetical protein M9H77_16000 [Catharanthus roseus]